MKKLFFIIFLLFIVLQISFAQLSSETITKTLQDIKTEVTKNNKILDNTSLLSDINGSRVMWSPGFFKAVDVTLKKLAETKLDNIHTEDWIPMGRNWEVKRVTALQTSPYFANLIAYPKNWSPATKGTVKAKAVYFEAKTEEEFVKYKGKLKGAIVLVGNMPNPRINYNPFVVRYTDAELKKLEETPALTEDEKKAAIQKKVETEKATMDALSITNKKIAFCIKEGAILAVDHGRSIYGSIQAWAALLPKAASSMEEYIGGSSNPNSGTTIPQLVVSVEQYNSLVRTIKKGIDVNLEINLETKEGDPRKGLNVIAEIPGTDLKNEIVMIGGHLDSQGPSIGATDNAVGVSICIEAMRVLKELGVQPRRTIRIALWGGEEQGYFGSSAYCEKHFTGKDDKEKLHMYFNTDFGAGRYRGIYLEERTDLVQKFKNWFSLINMNLVTCISKTENTDHVPFSEKGMAAFQFIQDPLDYLRFFHTNVDRIERIPSDDVRDNAIIMASLAFLAATE